MKGIWLLILVGSLETSTAFHASLPSQIGTVRNLPETVNEKFDVIILRAVSSEDAIERLRRQQEELRAMDEEKPPIIFDQEMIEEMTAAYRTLEKRVQQGPGSLTRHEMQELELRLHKIMHEMRVNQHSRPIKPPMTSRDDIGGMQPIQSGSRFDTDESDDEEGPRYDGSGGMGQPRGTVNTYTIPGMEDMSKDEYIKALQDQILKTQHERRTNGNGGNKATWSYLNSLSGKVEGILNAKPDSNQKPEKWKPDSGRNDKWAE